MDELPTRSTTANLNPVDTIIYQIREQLLVESSDNRLILDKRINWPKASLEPSPNLIDTKLMALRFLWRNGGLLLDEVEETFFATGEAISSLLDRDLCVGDVVRIAD